MLPFVASSVPIPPRVNGIMWTLRVVKPEAAALASLAIMALTCCVAAKQNSSAERVRVLRNDAQRRVDIIINEKPFTSYIWPERLTKPVLYPVRTAKGTTITRGFPLEPRQGERVDHPHHVGIWFNYGNANGFDFWNNSE